MGVEPPQSQLLESFKGKISECIIMVGSLGPEERISVSLNFHTDMCVAHLKTLGSILILQAVEYWNSVSEQLQEVINKAFDELEILEQCFEKSRNLQVGTQSTSSPDRLPGVNKGFSPSKAGISLLKPQEDVRKARNVLSSSVRIETNTDLESNHEVRDVIPENKDLSGRVLIVNEEIPTTLPSNVINSESHETTTVTVLKMDADNAVQFGLSRVEEEADEEDGDGNFGDDNDQFADTISLKITPEMAGVRTVTVNEAPDMVDETAHKVRRLKPDGSEDVVFQCEMCSKMFSTAASLTSHRWQHTKPFQCESCKERFASKGNLVIHRRRHTGDRPFQCNQCSSSFTTQGNLKRHVLSHTGSKPWACDQCDSRFTEKKSLKIHMRKHTGERPYVCSYCPKRFAQTSVLKSHVAMHLNQKTHLCDLCGKGFRQKTQLRMHVQRHKGVKKFDCSFCESKFLTKADLERHIKSHMGQRDFACTLCSKKFTRQQTLNEHMNRHYGVKPFECNICGKTFSEMSTVYKHVKNNHSTKSEKQTQDEIIIHQLSPSQIGEIDEDLIQNVVINIDNKMVENISIEEKGLSVALS